MISMHKIQIYNARQCSPQSSSVDRHHVILIKLCDFKFLLHRLFVPFKTGCPGLIPLDQLHTNRIQYLLFCINLIESLQNIMQTFVIFFLMANQFCSIFCKFPCDQFVFNGKIQHLYLKVTELSKKNHLIL